MKAPFSFKNARKTRAGRIIGWRGMAVIVGTAFLAWGVGFIVFVNHLPKAADFVPGNHAGLDNADGIVVLTGGALRLKTGLSLLESGAAPKVFVSGVHHGVDVSELLRVSQQNPDRVACCIELGHEASDTRGNAVESAQWAARGGYQRIILVTADYHMPRAALEFALLAPGLTVSRYPVFSGNVKTEEWYRFPGTALFIAGEYTKSLLTLFRYAVFVSTRKAFTSLGAIFS